MNLLMGEGLGDSLEMDNYLLAFQSIVQQLLHLSLSRDSAKDNEAKILEVIDKIEDARIRFVCRDCHDLLGKKPKNKFIY